MLKVMKIKAKGNTGGGTRAHIKGKGRRDVQTESAEKMGERAEERRGNQAEQDRKMFESGGDDGKTEEEGEKA